MLIRSNDRRNSCPEFPGGPKVPTIGAGIVGPVPVSRNDSEAVRSEEADEEKVLQLLQSSPGQAFSASEIANAVEPPSTEPLESSAEGRRAEVFRAIGRGIGETAFRSFLDRMVDQGKIGKRLVEVGPTQDWCYYSQR
jgi:hypothetical protein